MSDPMRQHSPHPLLRAEALIKEAEAARMAHGGSHSYAYQAGWYESTIRKLCDELAEFTNGVPAHNVCVMKVGPATVPVRYGHDPEDRDGSPCQTWIEEVLINGKWCPAGEVFSEDAMDAWADEIEKDILAEAADNFDVPEEERMYV